METIEKSVEVLNDLIQINNDRIAGFSYAIKELDENNLDLREIFHNFKEESRGYVHELNTAVDQMGGEPETRTSGGGALHRAWLEVKATFSGHDRKSILEECERGEDAIKKAYNDALVNDNSLTPNLRLMLARQQEGIFNAHDKIKALRNSAE